MLFCAIHLKTSNRIYPATQCSTPELSLIMPSAFRRAGAPSINTKVGASNALHARRGLSSSSSPALLLGAKGIKPWAGGIHLTSVGLNDLDAILGGGQPLGTCILLQEDRWTRDLAQSLVKYWVAEVRLQNSLSIASQKLYLWVRIGSTFLFLMVVVHT